MLRKGTKVRLRHLPAINAQREGEVVTIASGLEQRAYYGWWGYERKASWQPTYVTDSPGGMLTVHAICVYPLEGEHHVQER